MKHIYVNRQHRPIGAATQVWEMRSRAGGFLLGQVRWFNAWRRYCFFPEMGTIFEQDCLRDIAQFIEDETREHKEARKRAKAA